MHMPRFMTVKTIKEKSIWPLYVADPWHYALQLELDYSIFKVISTKK